VVLPVTDQKELTSDKNRWDVRIHHQDGNTVTFQVRAFGKLHSSSSSSSPVQGLGHLPVPASINSTFCMVYQDLFFLWACTEELASALVVNYTVN
jgi:hypothetical protein